MVYVACGAILLSLPLLYYLHVHYSWRSKLPIIRSKGQNPPPISIGVSDTEKKGPSSRDAGVVVTSSEKESGSQHAHTEIEAKALLDRALFAGSSQERATTTFSSKGEGMQIEKDSAQVTNKPGTSVPTTMEKPGADTSKLSMQPPARPGPRLRPKANAKLSLPSAPPQGSNSLRVPPTLSSNLRPPPSAASTFRTPPSRSLGTSMSAAPTASILPSSKRPSKKVQLEPGHSPLDWANLISKPPSSTYLRGDDVPSNLVRVPPSLLRYHNGRKGKNAWGVWQGKVYNLSPYMKFHPGGVDELMKGAGREKDGERLFMEVHPWVNWEGLMGECLVGILVHEEETNMAHKEGRDLEDMD
ncbi:MAG: hypothetical protein Q9173_006917 [Seirophora scorigena]